MQLQHDCASVSGAGVANSAGPVGLTAAEACRLRGAEFVAVGDPKGRRGAHADAAGFEVVVNPEMGAIPDQVAELLGTGQVDAGFDRVGGSASALDDVVSVTRPGGCVSIAGVFPAAVPGDDPKFILVPSTSDLSTVETR